MSDKKPYILKSKKEEKGSIELLVEISQVTLETYRKGAIKELGEDINIDGFRKGHIPEKIITERLGEMMVLEKVARRAIESLYPIIIVEEKIEAITPPEIQITKIAPGSNLEFKATVTILPEVKLPDYKKIAKDIEKENGSEATEKEINEYIEYLRNQRSKMSKHKHSEECTCEDKKIDEGKKETEVELPEFNDAFVKSLGNFKDVEDFKKQLRENMTEEKKNHAKQKRRVAIVEKLISETEVTIPQILIDDEINQMMAKFRHDIESYKINFDEYLKEIKKTSESLKDEWKDDARKRVVMNLLLPKIAAKENIRADEKKIKKEVDEIKKVHGDVDEMRTYMFVASILTNEAVFEFLENL